MVFSNIDGSHSNTFIIFSNRIVSSRAVHIYSSAPNGYSLRISQHTEKYSTHTFRYIRHSLRHSSHFSKIVVSCSKVPFFYLFIVTSSNLLMSHSDMTIYISFTNTVIFSINLSISISDIFFFSPNRFMRPSYIVYLPS